MIDAHKIFEQSLSKRIPLLAVVSSSRGKETNAKFLSPEAPFYRSPILIQSWTFRRHSSEQQDCWWPLYRYKPHSSPDMEGRKVPRETELSNQHNIQERISSPTGGDSNAEFGVANPTEETNKMPQCARATQSQIDYEVIRKELCFYQLRLGTSQAWKH